MFHIHCCLICSILEEAVARPWKGIVSGIRLAQLHGADTGGSQSSRQKTQYWMGMAGQHGSVPMGKQPEMGKATVQECFCVSGTLCMLTASLLTVNLLFLLQMRKLSQSDAMTFSGDLAGKWYQDTILGFLSGGFTFLTTALYCFSAEQGAKGGQCRAEEPSISWLR